LLAAEKKREKGHWSLRKLRPLCRKRKKKAGKLACVRRPLSEGGKKGAASPPGLICFSGGEGGINVMPKYNKKREKKRKRGYETERFLLT